MNGVNKLIQSTTNVNVFNGITGIMMMIIAVALLSRQSMLMKIKC